MTEEGKKAYMEAYGAEAMASGQSPQSAQNAENAKKINDLVMKQQNLNSKLNVSTQKIKDLYAFSANNPELENSFDKINEWQTKISLMSGVDYGQGKQMDSLANLIKKEKVKICNKYTPQMRNALKQHYVIMKSMIPDAILLADVTTELNKLQAGFTYPIESREIKALTAIQHYLSSLKEAYKYKLI
jgi:hypothetical protein